MLPADPASDACTVNPNAPAAVGVPAIEPSADNCSPAGSAPPTTLQVVAPVPPIDASDAVYDCFTFAPGSVVVAIAIEAGDTLTATVVDATRLTSYESRAWTTALNEPKADGVPAITPVAAFNVT